MSRAVTLAELATQATLTIASNDFVGIGSTVPASKLDVGGDVAISGSISVGGTVTYEDVKNVDSIGLITARSGIIATGVVTATSFDGDGSNLTGVSGFATALNSTQTDPLFHVFKTPRNLTVAAGTSAFIKSDLSSGNIAFTKMSHIHVSSGATVHVGSGTTFVTNVLSLF